MNKRIIVGHGVGKRIATLMGITPDLARRVRYMAIKDFGGIPVGDKLDPQK